MPNGEPTKFEGHNESGTDLGEVIQTIIDKGVPPGHILGIVYNSATEKYHVAYWTYEEE